MAKRRGINPDLLANPTGPHAIVGKALRAARLAKQMTAEEFIAYIDDRTLTKTLMSSYETGRHLPSLARLAGMLHALGAEITDDIRKHYADVLEDSPHMGQVHPGGRSRTGDAKRFIHAWQTSTTVQEAADKLGVDKAAILSRANYLRHKGVPLKRMTISRYDYEQLAAFADSFVFDDDNQAGATNK